MITQEKRGDLVDNYDLSGLKILLPKLPFEELWVYFHPNRSARGLRPEFTWDMLLKATMLQWKLDIADDVSLAGYLSKSKEAVELCGMPRAPSHDVLSRFTREHGHKFEKVHIWLDTILEEHGVFEDDDLAGDGTVAKLHKPQSKPDVDCFGAKSNFEKFYGLWLMFLVSVNTGLVRSFNYGKARVGQVKLMFDLLTMRMIQSGSKIFLDGIFDVKDIHAAVMFDQESLPMITYNHKNSKHKSRKDLPYDDWRGDYNPWFKDGLWMILESAKRTSVERTNSHAKMNTPLKHVYERSRRLQKRSKNHIHKLICGAVILPQLYKLMEIYAPQPVTLIQFMQESVEEPMEA